MAMNQALANVHFLRDKMNIKKFSSRNFMFSDIKSCKKMRKSYLSLSILFLPIVIYLL